MSKSLIYTSFLLLAVTLPFTSCNSAIDNQLDDDVAGDRTKVYLSVNIEAARTGGLRTINEDTNFEDRIHDLALVVFDSGTGERLTQFFGKIDKERTHYTFIVELTPGQRDFYFVANMPEGDFDKDKIPGRVAMDTYMKTFTEGAFNRNLDTDLYLGAADIKGFPMSRVYANQEVTRGGTAIQPKPFMPVPVEGQPAEDMVRLIRVVAKLEVDFQDNIGKIKNVYFKNAFRQFSLMAPETPRYTPQAYYTIDTKGNPLKPLGNTYVYYMPEALMESPAWGTAPHGPVNYFVIETTNGTLFNIPIITNKDIPQGNYMKFATGNHDTKPNYNIYRNHHYYYTVSNLENIEILYKVNPWDKVTKKLYMGYGYYVEVDEETKTVKITNTVDACDPHKVRLAGKNGTKINGADTFTFEVVTPGASSPELVLTGIPTSGSYLEVYYNQEESDTKPAYTFIK